MVNSTGYRHTFLDGIMPEGKIDPTVSMSIYQNYFLWLGVATVILGIIYGAIAKIMAKIAQKHNMELG